MGADVGFTHIALDVADAEASVDFYGRYAGMQVVHRRVNDGKTVVWLCDLTRAFVIVLIESGTVAHPLGGSQHLGVACAAREEVDQRCANARADGYEVRGPLDSGPPVGYWSIIADPDGHNLELSFGQDVTATVDHHNL